MESRTRSGGGFAFGPFRLDPESQRLSCDGTPVSLTDHQFRVLHALVIRAGEVVAKDALTDAAWGTVAVGPNSVEQVISGLRRVLDADDPDHYIQTVPRRGYRFVETVTRLDVLIDADALRLAAFYACEACRLIMNASPRHKAIVEEVVARVVKRGYAQLESGATEPFIEMVPGDRRR